MHYFKKCIIVQILPCLLASNALHNLLVPVFLTLSLFRGIVIFYLSQCQGKMLRSWLWQIANKYVSHLTKIHLNSTRTYDIRYLLKMSSFNSSTTKTMCMYFLLLTHQEDAWKKLFSQAPDVYNIFFNDKMIPYTVNNIIVQGIQLPCC